MFAPIFSVPESKIVRWWYRLVVLGIVFLISRWFFESTFFRSSSRKIGREGQSVEKSSYSPTFASGKSVEAGFDIDPLDPAQGDGLKLLNDKLELTEPTVRALNLSDSEILECHQAITHFCDKVASLAARNVERAPDVELETGLQSFRILPFEGGDILFDELERNLYSILGARSEPMLAAFQPDDFFGALGANLVTISFEHDSLVANVTESDSRNPDKILLKRQFFFEQVVSRYGIPFQEDS